MKISAKIVADSISPTRVRLATFLVTYHRFVHAEHLRHRLMSFNVSSSRAIPGEKFEDLVREADLEPVWWGKNQSGMQAREELDDEHKLYARQEWSAARTAMLHAHKRLLTIGVHKQIANRLLEPWLPVTVLVSATDWANFFKLRCHHDAQPEIQALADAMLFHYCGHQPQELQEGQWHMPFSDRMDADWSLPVKLKVSVARCARLSYLTFDGDINQAKDCDLHDRLAQAHHFSPFEHVARPINRRANGNFRGWHQYRKDFDTEFWSDDKVDLQALLRERQAAGSIYALGG